MLDSRVIYELFSKPDNQEGVQAFLAKRPVKFKGTMETDAPSAWPWWEPIETKQRNVREDKPKL